jgi:hypothetical protein
MTNEELERAMQFILEQQAQFTASQQQVGERVSRLETNMADMARAHAEMNEAITVMGRAHAEMNEAITVIGRAQAETDEAVTDMRRSQTHLNEVVAVMLDTHRHTEERLDAFIGVLERYISEGRNGKAGGGGAA